MSSLIKRELVTKQNKLEESGCRSDPSDQFFRSIQLSFVTFIMKYMRYIVKKLKVLGY